MQDKRQPKDGVLVWYSRHVRAKSVREQAVPNYWTPPESHCALVFSPHLKDLNVQPRMNNYYELPHRLQSVRYQENNKPTDRREGATSCSSMNAIAWLSKCQCQQRKGELRTKAVPHFHLCYLRGFSFPEGVVG